MAKNTILTQLEMSDHVHIDNVGRSSQGQGHVESQGHRVKVKVTEVVSVLLRLSVILLYLGIFRDAWRATIQHPRPQIPYP